MVEILRKLYKKYKKRKLLASIKRSQYIDIGVDNIIKPETNFDFRVPRSKKAVSIGNNCMLGCNFIFESEEGYISIGDRTYVTGGANLITRERIDIGNDVTIAWGCYIYDHNSHSLNYEDRIIEKQQYNKSGTFRDLAMSKTWHNVKSAPIKICDKVWLGFNVVVLKGVTIGEGAIVGACSVVTKDVPPYSVVAGNPARVVKMLK